jgi:phosphopantothenoylcysteine decarboxylase/phosphopantothenate--cysteine ligase
MLENKTVLLGISGSIAAYKAAELASKLTQAGAVVDVVMTEAATKFITSLTFSSITRRPVASDMFATPTEFEVEHIALAERADVVVIAPATANIMAKLAAGIADDLLTCTVLATRAPIILAPAMNVNMWEKQITQDNIARLRSRGFNIVDPGYGAMACGAVGVGRLADTEQILAVIRQVLGRKGDLKGSVLSLLRAGLKNPSTRCATSAIAARARWAMPWPRQLETGERR